MNTKNKPSFPLPTVPSVERQRIFKRRALATLSDEELSAYPDGKATGTPSSLEGIAVEETLARLVSKNLPEAQIIYVVVDDSHDAPHGHIGDILDHDRKLIANGLSDEWHDLGWTNEANDLAWDLHYVAKSLFNETNRIEIIIKP